MLARQLSFARPLIQRGHTCSSYSTALASLPSRDTPSRVLRVFKLPLNYDVSAVIWAIVGCQPLEYVHPRRDHITLTCYHWRQASTASQKRLQLYDKDLRIFWMDPRHSTWDDDESKLISAGVVARLGYLRACRSLSVSFKDEAVMREDSLRFRLMAGEEFESIDPHVTGGNAHGFTITFLSVEACSQFYAECRKGEIRGLPPSSVRFCTQMMRQFQETPRCVVIRHLQPTVALSRYLRDFVEALSSALFQARDGHLECDRITAIYQEPGSVRIVFFDARDARLFLDNFPAGRFEATMELTNKKSLHPYLKFAIQSGAGRALTLSLPHPTSLSLKEIFRDFSQLPGLVDVTMSTDQELILRYNSVLAASKTLCALETGSLNLPDKYSCARVSFLPTYGALPTKPITILERLYWEGRTKMFPPVLHFE